MFYQYIDAFSIEVAYGDISVHYIYDVIIYMKPLFDGFSDS